VHRLAEKAKQEALKHTHKLPRKLWEDKKEFKPTGHLAKTKLNEDAFWKEELSSLTTLVGAVALLLTVIAQSEEAEVFEPQGSCSEGPTSLTGPVWCHWITG
jgi:hypothetical protein